MVVEEQVKRTPHVSIKQKGRSERVAEGGDEDKDGLTQSHDRGGTTTITGWNDLRSVVVCPKSANVSCKGDMGNQ